MEPDDVVMIPGRLRTIREMRDSNSFLPLEKLNAAIETLEASSVSLDCALQQFSATGALVHGATPEELSDWAASVWDQLDQLKEARQRMLQEETFAEYTSPKKKKKKAVLAEHKHESTPKVPAVRWLADPLGELDAYFSWMPDANAPKVVLDLVPRLEDVAVSQTEESPMLWAPTHGLELVLQRAVAWGVPTPELAVLAKLDAWFLSSPCAADQLLETLKYTFWAVPTLRVAVAYLMYHQCWRPAVSLSESLQEFRAWLIGVLKTTATSAAAQKVREWLRFQNPEQPSVYNSADIPCRLHDLEQLTALLWLSVPAGDTQTALLCSVSSGPDREHAARYAERAKYYHTLWSMHK